MLVAWKLDHLSHSLTDVLTLMETVEKAGAGSLSLTEAVDTGSPAGQPGKDPVELGEQVALKLDVLLVRLAIEQRG